MVQVDPDHYDFDRYDYRERWISYYNQAALISGLHPHSILEVGVGNNFLSTYLRYRGFQVTTVDIDAALNPDIVASVDVMETPTQSDVVACFEVLEHLPYERFTTALRRIRASSKRYAVISLPHWGYLIRLKLHVPLIHFDAMIKISQIKKHVFNGQHYWEIGKRGYTLRRISRDIEQSGWKIIRTFIDADAPYHRFFLLEKK